MASIVDLIMALEPIAYFPLLSTHQSRDAVTGLLGTEANVGVTRPGPLSDTVIEFNDVDSLIEVTNFSDRIVDMEALSVTCFVDIDAAEAGTRQAFEVYDSTAGSSLFSGLIGSGLDFFECAYAAVAVDTKRASSRQFTVGGWRLISSYGSCGADKVKIRTDIATTSGTLLASVDAYNWDAGLSLFIGDNAAGSAPYENGFCHFAIYPRILEKADHDAIAAADSSGVWCNIDLGAGRFKINCVVQLTNATDWEYCLQKGGPGGVVYQRGTVFDLISSASPNYFYVPAVGNYFLTLLDPVSGESHAEFVPLVAA